MMKILLHLIDFIYILIAFIQCSNRPIWEKNFPSESALVKSGIKIVKLGDKTRIIIPSDPIYQTHSAVLKRSSYTVIDRLAQFLADQANYVNLHFKRATTIYIFGFTDNIGSKEKNQKLSLQRAQALAAYLWKAGIPFTKLVTIGKGQQDPIASNNTPTGNKQNRRIVVELVTIAAPS